MGLFINRLRYIKLPSNRVCTYKLDGHSQMPSTGVVSTYTPIVMYGGTCFSNALATSCISSIFIFANLAGNFHIALLVISLTIRKEASFPYLFAIYFFLPVKCLFIIIAHFFSLGCQSFYNSEELSHIN